MPATATYRVTLPPLHPGQIEVDQSNARFLWLACGRRWGKTKYGSRRVVKGAGEGGRYWWLAPTYKVASVGWRGIRQLAFQLRRHVEGVQIRQGDQMVILPTGGTVQVRSADDPDSLRGDSLDGVVFDECAFIQERAWTEAISPQLADREGWAVFISTPKGKNWFWRNWSAAATGEDPLSAAFRFSTFDNPHMPTHELDRIRAAYDAGQILDRVYRQEYLAEFIDDAGTVFRGVRAAATSEPLERGEEGRRYVIGCDWAKLHDFNVFTVFDPEEKREVHIDRSNKIDYEFQVKRLEALCERFPPLEVVAETNAMGEPLIERLERMDIPLRRFTTTGGYTGTKKEAIEALALAIETGDLKLLDHEQSLLELEAFEAVQLPSGAYRYTAPDGLHDDCVMSKALAWSGCVSGGMGVIVL